ncbi:two-component system response regulator [Advenella sp. S44]|uniref:response regulator n=1 Tax=Advenella sp. S44 TaxID=1982755 RepID=UPI000C29FCBD|nr:response regulator transcription factor [Advenella sp. S44]PJX22224.1 two-component system response regulator [Advenella sp. S44]
MKLLIIEDHEQLRSLLTEHMQSRGFVVDSVDSGGMAQALINSTYYDAMILDLGLPDMDGLQLLLNLRSNLRSPSCIVLTARDALESKIDVLNAGADDYVLKPVDVTELEARIRAVLRRAGHGSDTLEKGNLSFEPQSRHVTVDGHVLVLAKRELLLLEELLRTTPRIAIKDHLEERIYSLQETVTLNAIEALVSRLRRKLHTAGASVRIDTIRGIGYRLVLDTPHV